jgi:hypothetical protein
MNWRVVRHRPLFFPRGEGEVVAVFVFCLSAWDRVLIRTGRMPVPLWYFAFVRGGMG